MLGSLGTGLAVGAGVVAGEELAHRFLDGGERRVEGGGGVHLSWIGATGQPVTSAIADSLSLARPGGVLVKDIYPGGPLANAGVKSGDVVLTVAVVLPS